MQGTFNKLRQMILSLGLSLLSLQLMSCASMYGQNPYTSTELHNATETGFIVGEVVGGTLGGAAAVQGNQVMTGTQAIYAVTGAGALGALIGSLTGNYIDTYNANKIYALPKYGVTVRAVGDNIQMIMPPELFAYDSTLLSPNSEASLRPVANILVNFNLLRIVVNAYPDEIHSSAKEQALARERGKIVADYFEARGVPADRIRVIGHTGPNYTVNSLLNEQDKPKSQIMVELEPQPYNPRISINITENGLQGIAPWYSGVLGSE